MKVLILKPQDICYGIVNTFADHFGNALEMNGIEVVYFDLKRQPLEQLLLYMEEIYAAVIDIYSGLLTIRAVEGNEYFWNCYDIPIYQICLDFPVYIINKLDAEIHRHYALCMDRHYCKVLKECVPHITDSYFFPMAGKEGTRKLRLEERIYDIVFIGSYSNYREWLAELDKCEDGIKKIGYVYFCMMRDHVQLDQKQAFELTLEQLDIHLDKKEFYQWMQMIGGIAISAAAYQRERVLDEILQAGLKVEVYGDSWKSSPLIKYSNLNVHEQVDEAGYISVLEKAKISLNFMYSNKAGYTERYAYSMLNGAVCVSDDSEYLCEEFTDGENIVFYQLDQLGKLPEKIKWLLDHQEKSQKIADAAYQKARKEHTWEERAERFLKILEQ